MEVLDKYLLDNGVISTKEAERLGVKRHILAKLVKENKLERVKYGLYKNKEDFLDEYILISSNNNKVIFSNQTALFLYNFSDRTPNIFHITVPQGYNVKHLKKLNKNLTVHYVKSEVFSIGASQILSPFGNLIPVYDIERTICDIVANRKDVDKQIFTHAINKFFSNKKYNIRNLIKYSRILGVENEIRIYMEVLIWLVQKV